MHVPKSRFLLRLAYFFCLAITPLTLAAQDKDTAEFNMKDYSFLLPQPLPAGKYSHAVYLLYLAPPKDWTLDALIVPMFSYVGKYTLPKGFNVQGGILSLIIANRFFAGPFWNYSSGNFHFGAGFQMAYNFSMLRQFGFDTKYYGWEAQPSLTFGYSFGKTAVTIRGDLYKTLTFNLNEGGNVLSVQEPFYNGYSLSANFEQRLTRKRVMSLGFKLNYLRYHIIATPALPASQYRYFMPEFQIGWNFK